MRYPDSSTPAGASLQGRVLRWNFRHWIEVNPRADLPAGATFYGENKGQSRLEILTDGARHLNVLLHPQMVDMSAKVTIVVNGEMEFDDVPTVDLEQLLERVREFDDRGRIYRASVPLDISTDVAVPVPTYP